MRFPRLCNQCMGFGKPWNEEKHVMACADTELHRLNSPLVWSGFKQLIPISIAARMLASKDWMTETKNW